MTEGTAGGRHLMVELALLALLATVWGASYTFIKVGVATIPPVTFIAGRTMIAGALLLALLALRGVKMPRDRRVWGYFLVQACLNSVAPFTLIAWAEQELDAGLAAILNSTTPIFTFLLTALITRHEAASARKLFGVVAGMAGTCLIIGLQTLQGIGDALIAQLAIVAATICYAGAAIWGKRFHALDPMVPAAGSMLCGCVVLVPLSLILDRPWTLSPSVDSLLSLLALSIVSTALAFVLFFRLLRSLGSVGTTAQAYLRVPIGVGIGVIFLGESPSPTALAGLVCVVAGVMAMTIPARKRAAVA